MFIVDHSNSLKTIQNLYVSSSMILGPGHTLSKKKLNVTFVVMFHFSDSVTELELADTTVELCTYRHLCSSLGCYFQSFEDINRTTAAPLCQCDPECSFFDDCCQDYNQICQPLADEGSTSHLEGLVVCLIFWI